MKEIVQHHIEVKKTAHFYTLGNDISKAKFVWFVFHGYGQLASSIIRKFDQLDLDDHFIISLEGLSRFYWNLEQGTIGASWMSSKDRISEISDYLGMINQVYSLFLSELKGKKVYILGFSQGTSTAWRWIVQKKPQIDAYIQWAGSYPPEINYVELKPYLEKLSLHFIYGNEDQYITKENLIQIEEFIQMNLPFTIIREFVGRHTIHRKVLNDWILEQI